MSDMIERTSFDTPTLPTLRTIIAELQSGVILIPEFQRPSVWNDEQRQNQSPADGLNGFGGQQGLRFNEARGQWDASFRYTFDALPSTPQLTLDLINFTNEPRREYEGFENAV